MPTSVATSMPTNEPRSVATSALVVIVIVGATLAACAAPPPAVCTAKIAVHQPEPRPLADDGDAARLVVTRAGAPIFDGIIDLAGKGQAGGDVVAIDPLTPSSPPTAAVPRGKDLTLSLTVFSSLTNDVVAVGRANFECDVDGEVEVPLYLGPANAFAAVDAPRDFSGATVTALRDGRVLVYGGLAAGPSAVLFDPKAGGFCTDCIDAAALPATRVHHTATVAGDGSVVIVGGDVGGAPGSVSLASDVLRFDPGTLAFTVIGTLAVTHHVAAAVDSGVLVAGGALDASGVASADVVVVDVDSGIARTVASLATAREDAVAMALASGKVLVAGGVDDTGALLDSLELYDVASETWGIPGLACRTAKDGENMCAKRSGAAAVTLDDGNVLITGGHYEKLRLNTDPPPDSEVFLLDEERMLPASSSSPLATSDVTVGASRVVCAAPPCPALVAGAAPHRLFFIAPSPPALGSLDYGGSFTDAARAVAAPDGGAALVSLDDGTVLAVGGAAARFTYCEAGDDDGLTCPDP